jgi:nucleoside-diphosphate-sugar epimerase
MVTWRGQRVLVTGATGFIGAALTRRLINDRAQVHILARATSSPEKLGPARSKSVRHIGDLEDAPSLAAAVRAARPEVVFHLAKQRDGSTFAREAAATERLAAILRLHAPNLRRLVRTAHDAPARADDAALAAKVLALGLSVVTLELYLVYGPERGPDDFPRSMLDGQRPRLLSGAVKDYVWIDDVVEAYLRASHAGGVEGLTIPIGTGRGHTEAEAACLLLRLMGSAEAPPRADGPGAGHPADPSLARRMLGWSPRVLLEQGLARLLCGDEISLPDSVAERRAMIPWLGEPGGAAKRAAATPAGSWELVRRAADHFSAGDLAAAGRDADAFIVAYPGAAAGPAMKALLAAQGGDRAETERWLEACGPRGPEGWARALRGMMRARWGEHEVAREDLAATRRVERSAWASAERADAFNRVGAFRGALTELGWMRRAMPASPEPDLRAAAIHLEQAQYEEAADCLARAARLAPTDARVPRQLSRVRFVAGDLAGARGAIEEAWRLAPEDLGVRSERLRLCVLQGDEKACGALLQETWPPGERDFWLAYRACRQKRFDESQRLFAAAQKDCADAQLATTCALYGRLARVLSEAPAAPPPPPGKELLIMGLGFRLPYQASVEVLWALRGCEVIFSNLSDTTVANMLGLYGVPMRSIVFRRSDGQSTACARIVMRAMPGLGRAGVVTRGQPNYYGRLAYRLVKDCASRAIKCRIPPSVSIADLFPSLVGRVRGETLGLEVRDTLGLDGLDARLPVIVYNFSSGDRRRDQCRLLKAQYDPADPCWLMAGSGYHEYEPTQTTVGELEPVLMRADSAVTVLLPARLI